ncbi:MAG TPA: glycine--tRNA ligase subunit alpha, partial [Burkholderiaceae bacterium]|nr:glycine--tRNA ligase subunit alpha [Burkholderiaceae bacterium]
LARAVAKSYKESRRRLAPPFPMAPRPWAEEVEAQMDRDAAA